MLFGNGVFRQQVTVTRQVDARVVQLRLVARQAAFCLAQARLKWARVDLGDQLPGPNLLSFLEMQAEQRPADLGMDNRRVRGQDAADGVDADPDVLLARRLDRYRLRPIGATEAPRAAGSGPGRAGLSH